MSDSDDKEIQQIIELDFDFNKIDTVSSVFFKESAEILSDLDEIILRLEIYPHDEVILQSLFRKIHTLKGNVGAVPGGQLMGSLAHEFEALLERLRKQKIAASRSCIELFLHSSRMLRILLENLRTHREIYPEELSEVIELIARYGSFQFSNDPESLSDSREALHGEATQRGAGKNNGLWLSAEQVADLITLSSDFILLKNSLLQLGQAADALNLQKFKEKQASITHSFSRLSDHFQGVLEKVQKAPLRETLSGLFPLVRQTAYELKKEVTFSDKGFDLEIDKGLAQDLNQALIHMVRNSLDHGIETPEQRTQAGKDAQGRLDIQFEERSSVLHCLVVDDGRGMDRERILQRALEKGLTNALEATQMSDAKIFAFVFHPGFSTKEKVTTISGRGVGMDVVQNLIIQRGGEIDITSEPGRGTKIHLRIPLPKNLVVEKCLLASFQEQVFAFPLSEVIHVGSCDGLQMTELDHLRYCQFAGQTIPLLSIEELRSRKIILEENQLKIMSAVLVKSGDFQLAVLVDKIQFQSDLVIKPFGQLVRNVPGFKGTSLLTEEVITYVVDVAGLCRLFCQEAA